MFARNRFPVAAVLLALVVPPAVASDASKAAERVELQRRLSEQKQEIARLALYSARLDNMLGKAAKLDDPQKPPEQRLQRFVLQLDLDNVAMSDALHAFSESTGIELKIDWTTLHEAGIEKSSPVSCHVRNCTSTAALRSLLAAPAGATSQLWFGLDDGVVNVTTQAALAKHPVSKAFDVKFLLTRVGNPNNQNAAQAELSRVLMQTVAPDSWKEAGGSVGSISFAGTSMTVTQSKSALALVDQFLRTVEDTDLDIGNEHARQAAEEQAGRITAIRAEITATGDRLRAAGKKVPPEPLPIDQALLRTFPELKFDGVALADCVDFLRDVSGQEFFVNYKALESAGIDRDTPITLALRNRPLGEVITQLLATASAGRVKTGFDVEDNVLTLSTQADLDKFVLTENYEIRDLLPAGENPEQFAQKLIQSIQKAIEPSTWRDNGGASGAVHFAGGQLVITQSNRVHRLIAGYFDSMRHSSKAATTRNSPAEPK